MKLRTLQYFFWSIINIKSLKNWKNRNFSTPSPEIIKQHVLIKNNLKDSLWIETGTYHGHTTKILSKISKKVVSIEADKRLYESSKKKLDHINNIEIILGKSEQILEKVISQSPNKIVLAKINIDENQQIAAQLRIQSIPAVIAFKDKKPVNAFQGVIPETEIIKFL